MIKKALFKTIKNVQEKDIYCTSLVGWSSKDISKRIINYMNYPRIVRWIIITREDIGRDNSIFLQLNKQTMESTPWFPFITHCFMKSDVSSDIMQRRSMNHLEECSLKDLPNSYIFTPDYVDKMLDMAPEKIVDQYLLTMEPSPLWKRTHRFLFKSDK